MKTNLLKIIVPVLLLSACKNSLDGKKGHWTEKQKSEFIAGCESSAKQSETSVGKTLPEGYIKSVCACSLEKISSQQDVDSRKNISDAEALEFSKTVALACAKEFMAAQKQ